jgi:hypothetical protein
VIVTVRRKREVRERRLDADDAASSGPMRDERVGHDEVSRQRTATDAGSSKGALGQATSTGRASATETITMEGTMRSVRRSASARPRGLEG